MSEGTTPRQRLLVLIVAYQAESTLEWVLDRIPRTVFENFDCEVLVIDDGSEDRTLEVGRAYGRRNPDLPIRVLQNRYNQGYGGNQKIGYQYAIDEGFDFVALIHGDGQYAPEELPRLLVPLTEAKAEAVFGSRMMIRGAALKGGMPLYKYVGNRVLTSLENALLGAKLSEFHSGYRIYATSALERIRFALNTNDFHFDTEIIIQLLNAGMRIVELPIPTYYGDEICRVDGIRYAFNVIRSVVRNRFHRMGLMHARRFEPIADGNEHYDLKLGYPSSHTMALAVIEPGSSVLDIGGGAGFFARELVGLGCRVCLVDSCRPVVELPEVEAVVQDLDDPLDVAVAEYRTLLLLDVIEHLKEPEEFLDRLRSKFDYRPVTLILTTPNIAFLMQRVLLLLGVFNYGKRGILDFTHRRLFTRRTLVRLLEDAGFIIAEVKGVPAPFPKAIGDNVVSRTLVRMNQLAIRVLPTVFAYQFFVIASGTPDTTFLLGDARRADHAPDLPEGISAPGATSRQQVRPNQCEKRFVD